jgi:hypothetical protein
MFPSSNVKTRAHSKDLEPVSVVAEAAKKSSARRHTSRTHFTGRNDRGSMVDISTRLPNHDEVQAEIKEAVHESVDWMLSSCW